MRSGYRNRRHAPLHYLHARSPEPQALPLLITYGWPSSIVDFWHVIEPLTDPGRHGGDPADAFDVVLPSLPGFGFSGPTHDTGWNLGRHTAAMAELMRRLGYQRYAVKELNVARDQRQALVDAMRHRFGGDVLPYRRQ